VAYYERQLPHWQPEEAWLFVSWRLAGSLPAKHASGMNSPVVAPDSCEDEQILNYIEQNPVRAVERSNPTS
jgi:hypothetical protein